MPSLMPISIGGKAAVADGSASARHARGGDQRRPRALKRPERSPPPQVIEWLRDSWDHEQVAACGDESEGEVTSSDALPRPVNYGSVALGAIGRRRSAAGGVLRHNLRRLRHNQATIAAFLGTTGAVSAHTRITYRCRSVSAAVVGCSELCSPPIRTPVPYLRSCGP